MVALPAVAVIVAAISGGLATPRGLASWYSTLEKPAWNPPNAVFGPVWTVLYAIMAVAGTRIALSGDAGAGRALAWFYGQLALNALWSWLFFAWRRPDLAFVEILLLWLVILANVLAFFRIDRPSAWMLVPYLAWVTFAAILNATIWRLNR
jgi:tryptophan-rich sensory protein